MGQRAGVVRCALDDTPQPGFRLVATVKVAERCGHAEFSRHTSGIGPARPLVKGERCCRFAAPPEDLCQRGQRAGVVRRALDDASQPWFRLVIAAKRAQRASDLH